MKNRVSLEVPKDQEERNENGKEEEEKGKQNVEVESKQNYLKGKNKEEEEGEEASYEQDIIWREEGCGYLSSKRQFSISISPSYTLLPPIYDILWLLMQKKVGRYRS